MENFSKLNISWNPEVFCFFFKRKVTKNTLTKLETHGLSAVVGNKICGTTVQMTSVQNIEGTLQATTYLRVMVWQSYLMFWDSSVKIYAQILLVYCVVIMKPMPVWGNIHYSLPWSTCCQPCKRLHLWGAVLFWSGHFSFAHERQWRSYWSQNDDSLAPCHIVRSASYVKQIVCSYISYTNHSRCVRAPPCGRRDNNTLCIRSCAVQRCGANLWEGDSQNKVTAPPVLSAAAVETMALRSVPFFPIFFPPLLLLICEIFCTYADMCMVKV